MPTSQAIPILFHSAIALSPFISKFNSIQVQFGLTLALAILYIAHSINKNSINKRFAHELPIGLLVIILAATPYYYSSLQVSSDILKLFAVLICINLAEFHKKSTAINAIQIFIYISTIISSFSQTFFGITEEGEYRFSGIFGNVNLNSYIFCMCFLYLSLSMKFKNRIYYTAFLLLSYAFIITLSGTKSLLLLLPMLLVQILKLNKKLHYLVIVTTLSIAILSLYIFWPIIESVATLNPSFSTRIHISKMLISIILHSNIMPHGVGYTRSFLEINYYINSAHNDFIQYAIDYGPFFLIVIYILSKRCLSANPASVLFLLFYFSSALHNNLFSIFLLPYFVSISSFLRPAVKIK